MASLFLWGMVGIKLVPQPASQCWTICVVLVAKDYVATCPGSWTNGMLLFRAMLRSHVVKFISCLSVRQRLLPRASIAHSKMVTLHCLLQHLVLKCLRHGCLKSEGRYVSVFAMLFTTVRSRLSLQEMMQVSRLAN